MFFNCQVIISVSGNWSEWSTWSKCSVTCGIGISFRARHCLSGSNCAGDIFDQKSCFEISCPIGLYLLRFVCFIFNISKHCGERRPPFYFQNKAFSDNRINVEDNWLTNKKNQITDGSWINFKFLTVTLTRLSNKGRQLNKSQRKFSNSTIYLPFQIIGHDWIMFQCHVPTVPCSSRLIDTSFRTMDDVT